MSFRDQFTPAQEERMEAEQAWWEEHGVECPYCKGTGQGEPMEGAMVYAPCLTCNGRGLVAENPR